MLIIGQFGDAVATIKARSCPNHYSGNVAGLVAIPSRHLPRLPLLLPRPPLCGIAPLSRPSSPGGRNGDRVGIVEIKGVDHGRLGKYPRFRLVQFGAFKVIGRADGIRTTKSPAFTVRTNKGRMNVDGCAVPLLHTSIPANGREYENHLASNLAPNLPCC